METTPLHKRVLRGGALGSLAPWNSKCVFGRAVIRVSGGLSGFEPFWGLDLFETLPPAPLPKKSVDAHAIVYNIMQMKNSNWTEMRLPSFV